MKALKGLLIYIGIILGIILGLGLILLCIMYFFPSVRIFGIGIVHYSKVLDTESVVLSDYAEYSSVELNINSNNIDISIVPFDKGDINYSLKLNIFGASSEIVEYRVTKSCKVDNGSLKINLNVTEPKGWISTGDSRINVYVPASLKFSLFTTTQGGDISIGDSKLSTKLSSLSVSTNNGNLILTNIGDGEEEKTLRLDNLNLTTGRGNFDLSNIDNVIVSNKVNLVSSGGNFKFNNLNASLDISGSEIRIDAKKIVCGLEGLNVITKNGYFNVDSLYSPNGAENTFITDNTTINLEELSGKTGIVTSYGEIKIGTLNSYSMIENENGRVVVGTAKEDIIIRTTMGDISVNSYLKSGKFKSKKGNIDVTSNSDYVRGYSTEISNEDGKVNVYNKINLLSVSTTGKSRVTVTFGQIKSGFGSVSEAFQHQIKASSQGSCKVYIPTLNTIPFMFVATGEISGEITGFTSDKGLTTVESRDSEQYYPSVESSANTSLNASFLFKGKIELNGYSE